MKTLFIACFIILSFSFNCFAEWELIATDELVKESDLIVIGTLHSVSRYTKDNFDYSEGTIVIEKVVSGAVKTTEGFPLQPGGKIKIRWRTYTMVVCPRLDHSGNENKKGIWLLEVESDETVSANYLGRFNSPEEIGEIRKILRKVKTRKNSQRVKLLNEASENAANPQTEISNTIQNQTVEQGNKVSNFSEREYSPFNALLVALFSIGFYRLLYRSRFKIR